MKSYEFAALLTYYLMDLGFVGEKGPNVDMVKLQNKKGNTVYIQNIPSKDTVEVSVYKQTANAFPRIEVTVFSEMRTIEIREKIKDKLK